jgi:hypothetical protein
MSALSAQITQLPETPVAAYPTVAGSQRRTERRAEQALARRSRRRWSIFGLAIVGSSFALTVGILDVLH